MTNWKHTLDLIKADYSRLSKRGGAHVAHCQSVPQLFLLYYFLV